MANLTIKTKLTNVTDNASTTTSVSLDGIPLTVDTIISSRTFTAGTNYTFTQTPYVDLSETQDPKAYIVTTTEVVGTSKTFTIKYNRPLSPPTTDIITFFATAKLDKSRVGNRIRNYQINSLELHPNGEKRKLTVYGDPNTTLDIHVTKNPKDGPIGNQTDILKSYIATITNNGKYEKEISFPKTSLLTDYKVKLSERLTNSFSSITNPTTITLTQYPLQQTKLLVADGGLSTTLPADSVNNRFYYYSNIKGGTTYNNYFSFTVTKAANLATKDEFTTSSFTQATATSSTLTDTAIDSVIEYSNLSITINNSVSPKTARIEGFLKITHGYDSGGHTLITLDVNNILQNA